MGDGFLSKSFLFEIVDTNTQKIEKSFTLVIPPSAYSIKEKHRVTITKTFGNAFIDDYGADNLEITIRGISGTAHVFPTFRTEGTSMGGGTTGALSNTDLSATSTTGYNHKSAFYTFRDDIMRYRDKEDFDQKEMRVYDLADGQAYKCVLLEFSLDRTSEKPLHYPFTIQLFVYARMNAKGAYTPQPISFGSDPFRALDALDEATASLKDRVSIFDNVQNIKNGIQNAQNQISLLRAKFNTYLTKARTVIESPLTITKQLINILVTTGGFVYDAYVQGKLTIEAYVNFKETIDNQIREGLAMYGLSIQEGAQQNKEEVIETYSGMDYTDPTAPEPSASVVTEEFSGLNLYTVKGEDTLQTIALTEMGNSDYWIFIAGANPSITSNSDLVVGTEIYVPVIAITGGSTKDSFILTEDRYRDPYGADIRLDADGNIILLESEDVALVSGIDNILQALNIRLSTTAGSLVKQTAYGLSAQPGLSGTPQAISYLKMNFLFALLQDPRVQEVRNLRVNLDRDSVYVSSDLILVGYDASIPYTATL